MRASELEFITIGIILAPMGIKGKLKVEVLTDFPQRFSCSSQVYIKHRPTTIESTEWHKDKVILKLNAINTIEEAQELRGQPIEIPLNEVQLLPEGQFYHFQLIGLEVWTTRSELLGNITEVLTTQSNENYLVKGINGEIIIPAIEDVVKSIDLDKGQVVIEPIDGLLNLNKKAAN